MVLLRAAFVSSLTLAVLAIARPLSSVAEAGETWDGNGGDNDWTTNNNWTPNGEPPNDGTANIVMAGTNRLTPRVDVDWDIFSLVFNNTAGGFAISGAAGVSLGIAGGGISNQDTQTQVLLLPIDLNAAQSWIASQGPLSVGSTITGHPFIALTLTLSGAHNIQMSGAITSGVAINKTGSGTLTFNDVTTNTYTGATTVSAGMLVLDRLGGPNRAIPGNLIIGDGVGSDVVRLDTPNQISEAVGKTVIVNSSGLLNLNGFNETLQNLTLNGGTVSDGTLTVNGAITTGASTTSVISSRVVGEVTINGAGTLILSGSTTNNITTATVDGGTLLVNESVGGNFISTIGILGAAGAGNGSVIVTGAGSTWSNSGSVYVGGSAAIDGGNGTLSITNQGLVDIGGTLKLWPGGTVALNGGTLETANMELAGGAFNWTAGRLHLGSDLSVEPPGLLGTVAIGAGKTLLTDGNLYVGNVGSDTLEITAGGQVWSLARSYIGNQTGAIGEVIVDGEGSDWYTQEFLYVGKSGNGALNVTTGGDVSSSTWSFVGHDAGSMGEVTVDGVGSHWSSGNLFIGNYGNGVLNITDGGRVSSSTACFACEDGSIGEANVAGEGSYWTVRVLDLGRGGAGTLRITAGGSVNSNVGGVEGPGRAYIGSTDPNDTSSGEVRVEGVGSSWITHELWVGMWGHGSLQITDGASVLITGNATIGGGPLPFFAPGGGDVIVDGAGSIWTTTGLNIGTNGADGLLTVTNAGTAIATLMTIGSLGEIRGEGFITAAVENHGGHISPGASTGALHIEGDYTEFGDTELCIELASASSYDQLLVTSEATLAGTLTVSLIEGFVPTAGQSFTFLTADDVDGGFATEMLPSVPGLIFEVIYNPQSVVLTISSAFTADFDEDGDVDGDDLVEWQGDFGANDFSDADNDGDSDGADFLAWQRQLGSIPAIAATAVVPEPGTLLLFISALAGFRQTAGRSRTF